MKIKLLKMHEFIINLKYMGYLYFLNKIKYENSFFSSIFSKIETHGLGPKHVDEKRILA